MAEPTRTKKHYEQALRERRFIVTPHSFYVLGLHDNCHAVRDTLSRFQPQLIYTYKSLYSRIRDFRQDDINASREGDSSKQQKDNCKILWEMLEYPCMLTWKTVFFFTHSAPPQSIAIRRHSKGLFERKSDDFTVDLTIKFDESTKMSRISIMTLLRTFRFEHKRLFLNGILESPENVLMISSDPKYDYVLFNLRALTYHEKEEKIYTQLHELLG